MIRASFASPGGPVEDLQRDLAVERRVAGEVDDAHAAAAEDREQLVARAGDIRACGTSPPGDRSPARESPGQPPRFGVELLVGRALLAQRLEDQAAELAPGRGELVGDVDGRQAEPLRQLGVGRPRRFVAGQVVPLEHGEAFGAAARGAGVAQPRRRRPRTGRAATRGENRRRSRRSRSTPGAAARARLRRSRSGRASRRRRASAARRLSARWRRSRRGRCGGRCGTAPASDRSRRRNPSRTRAGRIPASGPPRPRATVPFEPRRT